ncbi:MAG: HDIG domain-containing protein [Anaerolineaceae bacterium]|nr:HDIG domain-containing protein [Anaerolineaceae bacterium]
MNREQAWQIVTEYTESPTLRRHMLSVEAAMRHYAKHFGEDEELWAVVGLLHDFDYEQNPAVSQEGHPIVGGRILKERGVSHEIRQAILAHAPEISGVQPASRLEKTLVAVDELTGFLIAVTLVRPSKDIREVRLKSVRKKWKDRAFAAAVNRAEIEEGAKQLGIPLEEHIQHVLAAMSAVAETLGLAGNR